MEYFTKWIQTYQTIIVGFIGVVGWIANHQLTLRAQNKNFTNQLRNTARMDITSKLREYQEVLIKLSKYYSLLEEKYKKEKNLFHDDIQKDIKNYINILQNRNDKWSLVMKEYQILIPELEQANFILNERELKLKTFIKRLIITGEINDIAFTLMIVESLEITILILEQISLIDDLLFYLQETSFAKISGERIHDTKSDGDNRPKFIIYDGKFKYVESKE